MLVCVQSMQTVKARLQILISMTLQVDSTTSSSLTMNQEKEREQGASECQMRHNAVPGYATRLTSIHSNKLPIDLPVDLKYKELILSLAQLPLDSLVLLLLPPHCCPAISLVVYPTHQRAISCHNPSFDNYSV